MECEYVRSFTIFLLFFFVLFALKYADLQILKYIKVHSNVPCRFARAPLLLYTSASFYHFVSKQFKIMK